MELLSPRSLSQTIGESLVEASRGGDCHPDWPARVSAAHRVLPHLILGEALRLLLRVRLWVGVGGVVALAIIMAVEARAVVVISGQSRVTTGDSALLVLTTALGGLLFLVLVLPLVAGDSLADDRRTGYLTLSLVRGVTRAKLIASRVVAGLLVSAAAMGVASTCWLLAAAVMGGSWDARRFVAGVWFAPALFARSPGLYFATIVMIFCVAGAAMLGGLRASRCGVPWPSDVGDTAAACAHRRRAGHTAGRGRFQPL